MLWYTLAALLWVSLSRVSATGRTFEGKQAILNVHVHISPDSDVARIVVDDDISAIDINPTL